MGIFIGGLVVVIILYVLILLIGIIAARKAGRLCTNIDPKEVMLAGRKIGFIVGCFTMTATWVGGGFINGTAEMVVTSGLVWSQAPLGYSIALFFGGLFFADKMRANEYVTMLDPYERKYGKWMAMLLYLPALLGEIFWSGAILNALGGTLAIILDIDLTISVIISAGISLLYTMAGGLYSVAYTDIVQLLLMLIGLWLSIPFAMTNDAVSPITTNSSSVWIREVATSDIGTYVDGWMLLIFGGIPWQVYFQRVLAARTPTVARTLSFLAAFGCVAMAIPAVLMGAIATETDWSKTEYKGNITADAALVVPIVFRYLCNKWVAIVGLGAVSAAVMSSTDSSMLSASSMFANNIFAPMYKTCTSKMPSGTALVWVMRFMQLVHAACSCALALKYQSIYVLFYLCSDLVFVVLFPQLTCVMYLKDGNAYGSLAGFVTGLLFRFLGGDSQLGIDAVIEYPWFSDNSQRFPFKTLAMLISLFTIIVVSYVAKFIFECGCLPMGADVFKCFTPHFARSYKTADEESSVAHPIPFQNSAYLAPEGDGELKETTPMPEYQREANSTASSRKSHITKIEVKKI